MATEKSLFDSVEKAYLQASLELKLAQVKRSMNAEINPEVIRLRNEDVGVLTALQAKIRSI